MMDGNSVEVRSVCKGFDIKYTTFYGGMAKSGIKQVLKGLSFDVKKGEVLGIIGRNGSGKSTILKLLSKIMHPDSGAINVCGNVASILELGMGFEQELSGRDNIFIKCGMHGVSKKDVESIIDDIIKYSELGEQIDHPLRTYSSGMKARLAFSILVYIKCDVLILDEVLSVGDASFNAKCKLTFNRMKKEKRTIIIASHNMATLEQMCDRVIWIEDGMVRETGDAVSVCYHFESDSTDSFETVCSLAETGDVTSQNQLGVMYRDGINTEKDDSKAIEWFSRASNMGLIEAQLNLANIKLKNGDKDGAKKLFEKASDLGNPIATICLINMNNGSDEISKKLERRIRKEAEKGNSRAMKLLAEMLYDGIVVLKDPVEAYQWYHKCAELGNIPSQYMVAICNRDGIGTTKNYEEAIKWFTVASDNGNTRARMDLATMYRKGIGVPIDMRKAIEWYTVAANCGDVNAMFQLGIIYRDGVGIDKNSSLSDYWLFKYSVQGRLSIEVTFGDILKQGYREGEREECIFWYEDAANGGNINGMTNLAMCYRDGIGVVADSSKAYLYYDKAKDMRHPLALFEISMMLMKGNGCQRDLVKSQELMKNAADMGNINAMVQYYITYGRETNNEKLKSTITELGYANKI